MHYFLGLEVWQKNGEIFLGQGRYAIDILKIFGIKDCQTMKTPIIISWNNIYASWDKEVGPTIYRQLNGSLMFWSTLGDTSIHCQYLVMWINPSCGQEKSPQYPTDSQKQTSICKSFSLDNFQFKIIINKERGHVPTLKLNVRCNLLSSHSKEASSIMRTCNQRQINELKAPATYNN